MGCQHHVGLVFFVSPDGWFVTAAHVITENEKPNRPHREDISKGCLIKESPPGEFVSAMCQGISFEFIDHQTDFALLKVDWNSNLRKHWLKGKTEFPYIEVSIRELDEGEPVYAYGYPLPSDLFFKKMQGFSIGSVSLCERVTSAIISALYEKSEMISSSDDPKVYVLDKALNYGNSGGPIVANSTGKVYAFCSRFQPVIIPQPHIRDKNGKYFNIKIPSLYGVVSRLSNRNIVENLIKRNIPISND